MSEEEKIPFWKLRSKHGRDTLFETADLLWEAACEYFQWCDENPWIKKDFKGKDATEVDIPTARPYTLTALCLYLDCSESYFREFRRQIRLRKEEGYSDDKEGKKIAKKDEDFLTVISRIDRTVYSQKFEGAAVGAFNANIISRDLGLVDRKDIKSDDEPLSNDVKVTIVKPDEE